MGLRSKLKGAIKRAVLGGDSAAPPAPRAAPVPPAEAALESAGDGNLAGGEDVPWYLRDGDPDGWGSTNATDDADGD